MMVEVFKILQINCNIYLNYRDSKTFSARGLIENENQPI